jgi:predicted Zn-dependent protease
MSKRLAMLEKMVQGGSKDPFHWYALALEYVSGDRIDDAAKTFEQLREIDPGYVPMYLMCGTTLAKAGRTEEARAWLQQGVSAARSKGDSHALSEIEAALAGLSS